MGGGDLNLKKSWHPQTLRNVEKVWKAEQKAQAETNKIEQLRRELDEEREREEMQRYAIDQGMAKKKSDRLEWMYSAPGQTGVNREDYLLGKSIDKAVDPLAVNDEKNAEAPGASFVDDAPSTSSDLAAKIRDDPLFMIKKKENEKKKELLMNPVRMKQLQQMLKADLSEKTKKKAKKDKKKRKREKRKKHSSDEYKSKENRNTSSHDQKRRSKDSDSSEDSSTQTNGFNDIHQKKHRSDSRNSEQHRNKQSRDMDRHSKQTRQRSPDSPERDNKYSTNNLRSYRSRRDRSSSRSPSPRKQQRPDRSPRKYSNGVHHNSRSGDYDNHSTVMRRRSRSPLSPARSSRREDVPSESRSFSSRKNKQNTSGSTRKMTDEERERKLAEMMDNAKWRDEQRGKNVTRYKIEDEKEAKEIAKHNEKGASFAQPMKVQTFTSSTASVENRIKRNIHSLQRTPAALEKFLRK